MHALSVRQPWCEQIASGEKIYEYRTWAPRSLVGRDLLIVASRTLGPGYRDEPIGVAICVVRVGELAPRGDGYAWRLHDPRRVEPEPIKGCAALWVVDDARIRFAAALPSPRPRALQLRERPPTAPTSRSLPYAFRVGRRVVGGERDPLKARTRAADIATEMRAIVRVERDGIEIYSVEPAG